jgi:hypothetical protein
MPRSLFKLDARLVERFAGAYLSPGYDQPHPVCSMHREGWELYCDETDENVALAAPRKHGKSSAFTDAFLGAAMLFRWRRYCVLFSASESLAIEHLSRTVNAIKNNELIQKDFGPFEFIVDTQTDVIIKCLRDGYTFRISARGSGQKIRGMLWLGMRPDLLLGDDLESEENVSTVETRKAFRAWFFRVAKQLLGEGGLSRIHGTILHDDSLLWNLTHSKSWTHRIYRAHASYTNFNSILWPARFSEAALRKIQQEFIDAKDPGGYSCEYLNAPRDREDAYLKKEWFLPLEDHEKERFGQYAVGVDLATSQADNANSSVFAVGRKCVGGHLDIMDRRKGRMDGSQLIDEFFSIQIRWNPAFFFVESGQIWLTLKSTLEAEMRERDIYLNIIPKIASKDKATRGRPMQKRMKNGGMSFNKDTDWYPEYEAVMLLFTAEAEALEDDDFDATAWLVIGVESMPDIEPEDDVPDEEIDFIHAGDLARVSEGRNTTTGY